MSVNRVSSTHNYRSMFCGCNSTSILTMGSQQSKINETVSFALRILMDLIKQMRESFSRLFDIEWPLDLIAKAKDSLSEVEKDAVRQTIAAHRKYTMALYHARVAVRDVKGMVSMINRILNSNRGSLGDKVCSAIRMYTKRIDHVIPKLEKAGESLTEAALDMEVVQKNIVQLLPWCDMKLKEIEGKKDTEIIKKRGAAYGGAAINAATVGVVGGILAAMNWWNPVGWIAAGVAFGATTGVSFGLAAASEGVTVKKLKKFFNEAKEDVQITYERFLEIADASNNTAEYLKQKTDELGEITRIARDSSFSGKDVIENVVDDIMFEIFKEDVEKLEKLCDEYLRDNLKLISVSSTTE